MLSFLRSCDSSHPLMRNHGLRYTHDFNSSDGINAISFSAQFSLRFYQQGRLKVQV